jgi:hypothetical protein
MGDCADTGLHRRGGHGRNEGMGRGTPEVSLAAERDRARSTEHRGGFSLKPPRSFGAPRPR